MDEVKQKEARAEEAKQRVTETLHQLQTQLSPSHIAHKTTENLKARGVEAAQTLKERGTDAARTGVETARRYPGRAAAVGGVLALIILRKPLGRLFRRRKRVPAAPKSPDQYTPEGS